MSSTSTSTSTATKKRKSHAKDDDDKKKKKEALSPSPATASAAKEPAEAVSAVAVEATNGTEKEEGTKISRVWTIISRDKLNYEQDQKTKRCRAPYWVDEGLAMNAFRSSRLAAMMKAIQGGDDHELHNRGDVEDSLGMDMVDFFEYSGRDASIVGYANVPMGAWTDAKLDKLADELKDDVDEPILVELERPL